MTHNCFFLDFKVDNSHITSISLYAGKLLVSYLWPENYGVWYDMGMEKKHIFLFCGMFEVALYLKRHSVLFFMVIIPQSNNKALSFTQNISEVCKLIDVSNLCLAKIDC
jgi:hypothetical protein